MSEEKGSIIQDGHPAAVLIKNGNSADFAINPEQIYIVNTLEKKFNDLHKEIYLMKRKQQRLVAKQRGKGNAHGTGRKKYSM